MRTGSSSAIRRFVLCAAMVLGLGAMSAAGPASAVDRVVLDPALAADPHNNVVDLYNDTDGRFMVDTSVKLTKISNDTVTPVNLALVQASCVECKSIGVTLQLVLYNRGASNVSPENGAFALNLACTRCMTAAHASQVVLPVDDVNAVPNQIRKRIDEFAKELRGLQRRGDFTAAEARISDVVAEFRAFGDELKAHPEMLSEGDQHQGDGSDEQRGPSYNDEKDDAHTD